MGWSFGRIIHYKNGKVDRKAEVYDIFGPNIEVIADGLCGSTYYGAVRNKVDNPDEVFAVVVLTRVRDGEFGYKAMTENIGPCYFDCPKKVLDALTPTTDETSLEWRRKCEEKRASKKEGNKLNRLGLGSAVKINNGAVYIKVKYRGKPIWYNPASNTKATKPYLEQYEYQIIKEIPAGESDITVSDVLSGLYKV